MNVNKLNIYRAGGAVAVVLGFMVSVFGGRGNLAGDGVSYLDVGDALMHGQWRSVLNGYWSPLFPSIESVVSRVFRYASFSEPAAVASTQFLIYVLSLLCFQFFWRQVFRLYASRTTAFGSNESCARLTEGYFWALGYTVFLYSNLPLLLYPSPDLLLSALVSLSEAMILLIYLEQRGWPWFFALAGTLGLAFLTKAVLMPLSAMFWLAATLVPPVDRRAISRGALVAGGFLLVVFPYIAALSAVQGRLTYGSAGSLNYAFHGNHVPYIHWQGPPTGFGVPAHPTRQLLAAPSVYEFEHPIAGTYPPWDNPTYWNEGVVPHLFVRDQLVNSARNLVRLRPILGGQLALFGGVAILLLMRGHFRETVREFLAMWYLWLPTAAAIALYTTLFVEHRYLAPYWALGWAALFCLIRLPGGPKSQRSLRIVTVTCVAIAIFQVAISIIPDARLGRHDAEQQDAIARGLLACGTQPGTKVAVMNGFLGEEWQRLAHVSVVADVPVGHSFWASSPSRQADVYGLLAEHGVTTLVAESVPESVSPVGWQRISGTPVYVRSLKPAAH